MARNPILPGFNPDPSICRVGDDYYIATSTFEWYPGVQVHHSRDLENWKLAARPLDRESLLDLRGVPDSCGVWAPCLSYDGTHFWLIYTVVRRFDGDFKDTHNYLTRATSINGPWEDPVYLNSSGFDPSLFHDADGRRWLLNMVWDHRPDRSFFGGIVLQEYSERHRGLIGRRRMIFAGSDTGYTEGPHLYRHGEYYYLLTAEGGTGYGHAVTLARSRTLEGPYEVDPAHHMLTARDHTEHPLQRAGHADIVETADGRFFMAHLCSRPLPGTRRSPMGRETALQQIELDAAGWFRLTGGGMLPAETVGEHVAVPAASEHHDFSTGKLPDCFQWLRTPYPESWLLFNDRQGWLTLVGRESLGSWFEQALVARRQTAWAFEASTLVDFEPDDFQQAAGLVCYYNAHKYHYLYVSHDPQLGRHVGIMSCEGDLTLASHFPMHDARIALPARGAVALKVTVDNASLQFHVQVDGQWRLAGPRLDASLLSDEAGKGEGANFTGAFVGVCCQDLTGRGQRAHFRWFDYSEMPFAAAPLSN